MFLIVLNHLTHATLRLDCIGFHQFVPLVKKLFQNLQVLRISTIYGDYLNADQWERLILSSMPYLRIFDIRETCQTLFSKFNSSFWSERKWFFSHRHHWGDYSNRGIFYSTKPYRYIENKRLIFNIYFFLGENIIVYMETMIEMLVHVMEKILTNLFVIMI